MNRLFNQQNCNISIRVDANGGWSLDDAKIMMKWLADRKAEYIEQPLKEGMRIILNIYLMKATTNYNR